MASIMTAIMLTPNLQGQIVSEKIGVELTPDITWRIEDNTLYLSGNGVVPTTMFGAKSAWNDHRSRFNSVIIEDGITGLGQNVFVGYKNITSLTIAGTVRDLAPNSFNTCKNLSVVELKGATPTDINSTVFYKLKFKKAKLVIPAGTKAIYESDPFWSQFGKIEESNQLPTVPPAALTTLAEPCNIHLTRTANFIGGGALIRVFLNGVEQEKIGNGQTIMLQTDRVNNELYLQWGKKVLSIRRFEAITGSNIHIEYSNFLAYMKVIDEDENDEE